MEENGGKDKNDLGTFIRELINFNKTKVMWHSNGFSHKCTAGESKEFVGVAKDMQYLQEKAQCRINPNMLIQS